MEIRERLTFEWGAAHPLVLSEHLHRYELARELCADRRVLDLCCGTGYGSQIIRQSAVAVTGVDNDVATIDTARVSIGDDSDIHFETADALEYLQRADTAEFEVIVCFEGLEHLRRLDSVVERLHVLADQGTRMIISLPNSRAADEDNRFHVTDFGYEEAIATFDRIGAGRVVYQFLAEGSVLHSGSHGDLGLSPVLPEYGEIEWANHFIGLIGLSEQELPEAVSSRIAIALAPTANRHQQNLLRANRLLWRENARLARELMVLGVDSSLSHSGTAAAAIQLKLEEERSAREDAETRVQELEARMRELSDR